MYFLAKLLRRKAMNKKRFITYEHRDTGYDVEVMSQEQFDNGGSERIRESDCWIWQFAESEEEAKANHVEKHAQWEMDVNLGNKEKETY